MDSGIKTYFAICVIEINGHISRACLLMLEFFSSFRRTYSPATNSGSLARNTQISEECGWNHIWASYTLFFSRQNYITSNLIHFNWLGFEKFPRGAIFSGVLTSSGQKFGVWVELRKKIRRANHPSIPSTNQQPWCVRKSERFTTCSWPRDELRATYGDLILHGKWTCTAMRCSSVSREKI